MEKTPNEKDAKLLLRAKRRVFLKKTVKWHAIIYLAVNALLCVIYCLSTPSGYFWPLWSIVCWGAGLIAHAVVIKSILSPARDRNDLVEKEYEALQKEQAENNS